MCGIAEPYLEVDWLYEDERSVASDKSLKKKRSMQWCRVVQAVGLGEKSYLKVSSIYTVYTIQYTVYLKWEAQFWSGVVEADLEAHWLGEAVHFGAAQ